MDSADDDDDESILPQAKKIKIQPSDDSTSRKSPPSERTPATRKRMSPPICASHKTRRSKRHEKQVSNKHVSIQKNMETAKNII